MSHIHDKIDFTATGLIVHENKILMRFHDKYKQWLGVGGHIELDEDPAEAMLREVKEESGLDVEILGGQSKVMFDGSIDVALPSFINRHRVGENHEHVDSLYVVRPLTMEIQPQGEDQNDEVEFRWMDSTDLDNPEFGINPRMVYYAKRALLIAQSYE